MDILAWVLGILGGLCAVMGVVTAVEVTAAEIVPLLGTEMTWTFWFRLAGILFIACIAAAVARGKYEE